MCVAGTRAARCAGFHQRHPGEQGGPRHHRGRAGHPQAGDGVHGATRGRLLQEPPGVHRQPRAPRPRPHRAGDGELLHLARLRECLQTAPHRTRRYATRRCLSV